MLAHSTVVEEQEGGDGEDGVEADSNANDDPLGSPTYTDGVEAAFQDPEVYIPVFALANAVWDLPPPLPSPLSSAVVQHHTEVVIDCSEARQRRFWEQLTPQTARDLGRQMINLKSITHRYSRTADGVEGRSPGRFFSAP
ncbi:unnamed protein product [Vitrella brassicaformis CCMP3155]|uniref:Uncharacterized protein n=1 Tax=Vitrella brassicaformis (strain CCMP3155) TaxID=1169540 RepID=A0A0G4GX45_VITBC|nr:unnamed protein product [Vitrella brassicaformis CCMP3155]|eukprot:CEM35621.1 unnamed protein product [Vitrella brassicaformis CCMP3155]